MMIGKNERGQTIAQFGVGDVYAASGRGKGEGDFSVYLCMDNIGKAVGVGSYHGLEENMDGRKCPLIMEFFNKESIEVVIEWLEGTKGLFNKEADNE